MRTRADRMMVVGGVFILVLQAVILADTPLEYVQTAVGILIIGAGLWGLGRKLRGERRIYLKLRAEFDQLSTLVRKLNAHAVDGEGEQAAETQAEMHECVDRIAVAAGVLSDH